MTPPRTLEEALAILQAYGGNDWATDALMGLVAVCLVGALLLAVVAGARRVR